MINKFQNGIKGNHRPTRVFFFLTNDSDAIVWQRLNHIEEISNSLVWFCIYENNVKQNTSKAIKRLDNVDIVLYVGLLVVEIFINIHIFKRNFYFILFFLSSHYQNLLIGSTSKQMFSIIPN